MTYTRQYDIYYVKFAAGYLGGEFDKIVLQGLTTYIHMNLVAQPTRRFHAAPQITGRLLNLVGSQDNTSMQKGIRYEGVACLKGSTRR